MEAEVTVKMSPAEFQEYCYLKEKRKKKDEAARAIWIWNNHYRQIDFVVYSEKETIQILEKELEAREQARLDILKSHNEYQSKCFKLEQELRDHNITIPVSDIIGVQNYLRGLNKKRWDIWR